MNRTVIFGVLLGAAVLLGMSILPGLFSPQAAALAPLRQAEQARRELESYNQRLTMLGGRIDIAALKEADLARLAEAAPEESERINREISESLSRARQMDQKNRPRGMPMPELPAIGVSPTGLRTALSALEAGLRENQALLSQAVSSLRAVEGVAREVFAVAYVKGMVELARGSERAAEARRRRDLLDAELAGLVRIAQEIGAVRAEEEQAGGFDVSRVLAGLEADLKEVQAAQAEAQARAAALQVRVREVQEHLAELRGKLKSGRDELLRLEQSGFVAGDEASFEAYRQRYEQISAALNEWQQEEQLLAAGGLRGARIEGGDLLDGELRGGEVVEGLEELERRLEVANEAAARWGRGIEALTAQIRLVTARGQAAQQERERHAERLRGLLEELERRKAAVLELDRAAFERENEALAAARAAQRAFAEAGSAIAAWMNRARTLQSEKDAARKNERLKSIIGDQYAPLIGPAAEAQASVLTGRVLARRCTSLAALIVSLDQVVQLVPGFGFERDERQQALTTAREEALDALRAAAESLKKAAAAGLPTRWIYQAGQAYVTHLMALVDPAGAARYRAEAASLMSEAVARQERSPYLARHVAFLRYLSGEEEAPPPSGEPARPMDENAGPPPDESGASGEGE